MIGALTVKWDFTKMHGCGNDYIYFNCLQREITNPSETSIRLSDRHFGIGGDGIVLICPSEMADAKMRMFNADGSEGKMCGNAIRCVGKYLFEHGIVQKQTISIETLSGIKYLSLTCEGNFVKSVEVQMGKPIFDPKQIPVLLNENEIVHYPFTIADRDFFITCVSMGNPHCVVFCDDVASMKLDVYGPLFEKNALFPEGINTEFVQKIDDTHFLMRVWERGSGETWACGTGACAVVAAAVKNHLCEKETAVNLKLLGGTLVIRYAEKSIFMQGNAVSVFSGSVDLD